MKFEMHLPNTDLLGHHDADPLVITITSEKESDHTALLALIGALDHPGMIKRMFEGLFKELVEHHDGQIRAKAARRRAARMAVKK